MGSRTARCYKALVTLLLLTALSPLTAQEAYRWRDAGNTIHYGDHPPADARELQRIPIDPPRYQVKRVFDGDTVQLTDGRRLRLIGINTPERARGRAPAEAGAESAYDWLHQRLQGQRVELRFDRERRDRYARWLVCLHDEHGTDIGLELLRAGLAHVNIPPQTPSAANATWPPRPRLAQQGGGYGRNHAMHLSSCRRIARTAVSSD